MLSYRLLTAIILIPPFLAGLWLLPTPWVMVMVGIFMIVAAWEWSAIADISSLLGRMLFVLVFLLLSLVGFYVVKLFIPGMMTISVIAVLWWCLMLIELIKPTYLTTFIFSTRVGKLLAGLFIIIPGWLVAYYLHLSDPNRPLVLFLLILIVWTADSVAYFVGRTLGRHKLAPAISPGKTVEGAIGGVVGVILVVGMVLMTPLYEYVVIGYSISKLIYIILMSVIVALFSLVGDLVESKFKRIVGVKDSGTIIPGHGGVLDRIDAYTSAAPVFMLGWLLLGSKIS
jgi:phosphatidate cytidylyltransferase